MSICPQQEHQVSALDFNIFDIFGVWSSTFLCSLKTTSTQHLYRPVQGQQQVHSTAILCCIHCSFSAPTALSLLAANTHTHTHTHTLVSLARTTHTAALLLSLATSIRPNQLDQTSLKTIYNLHNTFLLHFLVCCPTFVPRHST